ncbi:MAG: prolipoprotein diacylglyceryl transferase [Oscillospiraceae bacterium]|nr:prolipoprotein diacylglyceryl transferase [Oscillospiraceae bacterium]
MTQTEIISFPFLHLSMNPPESFVLFGRTIHLYGAIIAFAFLFAIWYCTKRAKSYGIKEDDVYDVFIFIIPCSIIGARLYYVAFQWDFYSVHPDRIIAIWEGGLAIYGGVLTGLFVIFLICRHKKIPLGAMLDLVVFALLIGQVLGRWGNFFNREAYGAETEIFCRMGLTVPGGNTIYVHPTFLYESLWNLVGYILLVIINRKGLRRFDGQHMLSYFVWYGIGRFWIEGLRSDSLYIAGTSLRVSQLLSLVLAIVCGILLIRNLRKPHVPEDLFVNRSNRIQAPAAKQAE